MSALIVFLLGLVGAPTWLITAAQLAWTLLTQLPWFQKPAAFQDLYGAIAQAKVVGNDQPIKDWHVRWEKK